MGRAFTKFQYGKEVKTTHGTAVPATKMLLADPMAIKTDRKPEFVEDAIGVRAGSYRSRIDQYHWQDTLKISNGYFQALPMIFSCGLKGDITAAEVTPAQGDYLWTFTPSLTATNTPDSITLGDDVQAYEVEYLMFNRIKISGKIPQGAEAAAVAIEAEGFGRQLTDTTFTGGLSLPSVENMNAKLARFSLDTTWAGVGVTEKTGILRGFEAEILTGAHPKFFDTHGEDVIAAMLTLDLEAGAVADLFWDAMRAGSLAVARLKILGAQIGTGTTHSLVIDVGGRWEDVTPQNEYDKGNAIHKAILHGMYDPTGAKICQVTVTTNLSVM
jgi:hypothetical protein